MIWSVFLFERKVPEGDSVDWVSNYSFYQGDLSDVDLETDWRFCEVKDRRKTGCFYWSS